MMSPTDDVRIDPEITTRLRAIDRRALVKAGAAAAGLFAARGASAWAAPLAPIGEDPEDPWESGECDVPANGDEAGQPEGTPGADDAAVVLPFRILIPAIDVDARVEVLEVVDGFLQDPSNGDDVAWYKETARAGEEGNAVYAGHLNWYGMPEAVFFAIDQLKQDDEIFVRDGSCSEHRYLVEWTELIVVAEADMEEITGQGEESMLTLITCGGEWDPSISQYKQRTVVRARLADADDDLADEDVEDEAAGDGTGGSGDAPPIVPRSSD